MPKSINMLVNVVCNYWLSLYMYLSELPCTLQLKMATSTQWNLLLRRKLI